VRYELLFSMLDYVKFEIISFRCEVQQNFVGVRKFGTDMDRARQLGSIG
jgi:hypothetical protein